MPRRIARADYDTSDLPMLNEDELIATERSLPHSRGHPTGGVDAEGGARDRSAQRHVKCRVWDALCARQVTSAPLDVAITTRVSRGLAEHYGSFPCLHGAPASWPAARTP